MLAVAILFILAIVAVIVLYPWLSEVEPLSSPSGTSGFQNQNGENGPLPFNLRNQNRQSTDPADADETSDDGQSTRMFGETRQEEAGLPSTSARNRELTEYAANFDFQTRDIAIAEHEILGMLFPQSMLTDVQRAIANDYARLDVWNDFDFQNFPGAENLEGPYRAVRLGDIVPLSENRTLFRVELDGFELSYFLEIVLYSAGDGNYVESVYQLDESSQ